MDKQLLETCTLINLKLFGLTPIENMILEKKLKFSYILENSILKPTLNTLMTKLDLMYKYFIFNYLIFNQYKKYMNILKKNINVNE